MKKPLDRDWLILEIKHAERATQAAKARALKKSGLTRAQFTTLYYLQLHPNSNSAALARMCDITPQAMGQNLTGLLERGYVAQNNNPTNKRQLLTSITPSGQKILRAAMPLMQHFDEVLAAALGEDVAATVRGLKALRQAAEAFTQTT